MKMSRSLIRVSCRLTKLELIEEIYDRQNRVPGVTKEGLWRRRVILVGAGGIGSEVGEALVRKGVGSLEIYDRDTVSLSNLNRQFFFLWQIGKSKSRSLVANLLSHAIVGTRMKGHACHFDDALAREEEPEADLVVCGVDNNKARLAVSDYCERKAIPCIHIAVDAVAESCSVFVQKTEGPSFREAFPDADPNRIMPCRVPSAKDPIKVAVGLALYAIDSTKFSNKITDCSLVYPSYSWILVE